MELEVTFEGLVAMMVQANQLGRRDAQGCPQSPQDPLHPRCGFSFSAYLHVVSTSVAELHQHMICSLFLIMGLV